MSEKAIYRYSYNDAIRCGEQKEWKESHDENCKCAKAIEKGIEDNYKNNRLNTDFAKKIIKEFGIDRVKYVLANTVQLRNHDGRFSQLNKDWAKGTYVPNENYRKYFNVDSHPGLTDLFINRVRKEWADLGLFDSSHCTDEKNYEDKILVLKPSILKDKFKSPDFQLFYATSGFGCYPDTIGRKVNGFYFKDDESTHYNRSDFIGVIREDCLPDWAKQKLYDMTEGSQSECQEPQGPELKM